MRLSLATFATVVVLSSHTALAVSYVVESDKSPVTFTAVGKPGFLRIKGDGASLGGKATIEGGKLSGDFEVKLAPIKTGIDLRDEHMHEKYLESGKFPTATLKLKPVAVAVEGETEVEFEGDLTLKGVTRPVKGHVELEFDDSGNAVEGEAKFKLKLSDFPVGVPSHLGVTVAEDVEVTAKIAAAKG